MHDYHLVYKYLTPNDVIVTHGMHFSEATIKLRISHIAIMQLIDVSGHLTLGEKICGTNKVYIAPELLQKSQQQSLSVSEKADVWSVGAILYMLVIGRITDKMATKDTPTFDFSEPEWESQED